jgi:hypothetical protein
MAILHPVVGVFFGSLGYTVVRITEYGDFSILMSVLCITESVISFCC